MRWLRPLALCGIIRHSPHGDATDYLALFIQLRDAHHGKRHSDVHRYCRRLRDRGRPENPRCDRLLDHRPLADRSGRSHAAARAGEAESRSHADALHRQLPRGDPEHRAGGRHPRLLRRADHHLRRTGGRYRYRHRRGVGRPAVQLRGRCVSHRAEAVQGGRFHQRRRTDRHGQGNRPVRHRDQHPRQRVFHCRQQQDIRRHHPEFQRQSLPSRRAEMPARRQRRPCRRDGTAAQQTADHSQRGRQPVGRGRDTRVHPGRPGAGGAPVLPHRSLLAGVFRRQPDDSRRARRSRIPCPDAGATDADARAPEPRNCMQTPSEIRGRFLCAPFQFVVITPGQQHTQLDPGEGQCKHAR